MRFRYVDSKGKEIALDSVEALAARIELGAVHARTELFDSSTESWGPAEHHPVFRQLMAEKAARDQAATASGPVLDPTSPPTGGTQVDAGQPAAPAPGDGLAAADATPHVLDISGDLELETLDLGQGPNETAMMRQAPMDGFRATVSDGFDDPPDMGMPAALEMEASAHPQDDHAAPPPVRSAPPAEPRKAARLEIDEDWGRPDARRDEEAAEDPFAPTDSGGWPAEALAVDAEMDAHRPSRLQEILSLPAVQWGFLIAAVLVMAMFGSSVATGMAVRALLTVGGVAAVGCLTGLFLWSDPTRRTLIPAATFGLIALVSGPLFIMGARTEAAGSIPVESTRRARSAPPRTGELPLANPGEVAMEARALEEVLVGMDSLAVSYGLDRRPGDWLHGIYLAHASRYPEVKAYWERYGRYLAEVRTQDAGWFAKNYEARLRETGIEAGAIDGLVGRGLQRFMSTADRRARLYDTMEDLVGGSLELHQLLLENEADIDYTPFKQDGLSDAPVVEAVPRDPELEEDMWRLIGRIARNLEAVSELGETSPARLQAAMVDSIRASVRQ